MPEGRAGASGTEDDPMIFEEAVSTLSDYLKKEGSCRKNIRINILIFFWYPDNKRYMSTGFINVSFTSAKNSTMI